MFLFHRLYISNRQRHHCNDQWRICEHASSVYGVLRPRKSWLQCRANVGVGSSGIYGRNNLNGSNVGCCEGLLDGLDEGEVLGDLDGEVLGEKEGDADGLSLGELEGLALGLADGEVQLIAANIAATSSAPSAWLYRRTSHSAPSK